MNRYSYVLNNPLKYTDPSGHGWFKKLRRTVSGIFKSLSKPKNAFTIAATVAASSIISPAISGFLTNSGLLSQGIATITGNAVGGTVGVAAASVITGGDISHGALYGAFGGAAFGSVGAYYGKAWTLGRVAANAVAGGAVAQVSGGKFKDGAFLSAMTAGARYLYNKVVRFDIALRKGGKAVEKGMKSYPEEGANNIGQITGTIDPKSLWNEGGRVSRFANHIPGINATAGLHDVFQVSLSNWNGPITRKWLSIPGMPIAGTVTYAGALADPVTASYLATERN